MQAPNRRAKNFPSFVDSTRSALPRPNDAKQAARLAKRKGLSTTVNRVKRLLSFNTPNANDKTQHDAAPAPKRSGNRTIKNISAHRFVA